MEIVVCTMPIRPEPTDYPPLGVLAVMQTLRLSGYSPSLYDIDAKRPSFEDIVAFFRERRPALIGLSAVVSTSYAFTKKLALALKQTLPQSVVVVGGNMAASAELLHRRGGMDYCVTGDGEHIFLNLARYVEKHGVIKEDSLLQSIKGISYINDHNEMVFTGYADALQPEEWLDPDWSILEEYSQIDLFVRDPFARPDFSRDPRSYQPHRRGQKTAIVTSVKGCVNRCTFCHRWIKGYRQLPPERVIQRMRYLKDRYNVGFFQFGDENFGSDRKKLEQFLDLVKPLDVLYQVGGARCRSFDLPLLKRMKDSGCVAIHYGMETGSPRILNVMEKNTELQHNRQAAQWTRKAGLYTVFQMVLGMPGEDIDTVNETLDFIKTVTVDMPEPPHRLLSINYLQALPGSPVYEYARHKGLIGPHPDDEERYLLLVSNVDAADDSKLLNFTGYDYFTVQNWRHKILFEAEAHWYRVRGWKAEPFRLPNGQFPSESDFYTRGYFNLKKLAHNPFFYRYAWPFRRLYYLAYVLGKNFIRLPQKKFWRYLLDYLLSFFRRRPAPLESQSLRRVLAGIPMKDTTVSEQSMRPFRQGL